MPNTKITSNVLDSISKSIKGEGFSSDNGKALLLFNGSKMDLDKKLNSLMKLKNNGFDISIGFSFMAENILDTKKILNAIRPTEVFKEEDIFKLQSIVNDYSLVIGPNITINTLSKVALGMIDSFIPSIIWTFLYQGKNVYLDFDQVRNYLGNETKSKKISDITKGYILTVIKMGAIEIQDGDYSDKIILNGKTNYPLQSTEKERKKDLITEKDILNLSNSQGVLILESGTVITPLAKDKARELDINIQIK